MSCNVRGLVFKARARLVCTCSYSRPRQLFQRTNSASCLALSGHVSFWIIVLNIFQLKLFKDLDQDFTRSLMPFDLAWFWSRGICSRGFNHRSESGSWSSRNCHCDQQWNFCAVFQTASTNPTYSAKRNRCSSQCPPSPFKIFPHNWPCFLDLKTSPSSISCVTAIILGFCQQKVHVASSQERDLFASTLSMFVDARNEAFFFVSASGVSNGPMA